MTGGDGSSDAKRRPRSLFSRVRPAAPRTRPPEWSITDEEESPKKAAPTGSPFDVLSHGDLLASLERELGRQSVENRELRADLESQATALEVLRAREEKYRAAFQSAPIALVEADVVGTVTACSRAAITLLACADEDLIGKPLWQVAGSEDASDTLNDLLVGRSRKRDQHAPLLVELRRGDGSNITVELLHGTKTDDHARTIGSVISIADVSDRARREAEINASANAYRDLFDSAPVMLLAVDAKTTAILECNFAVSTATGYTREELLDRSIFDLYDPTSLDAAAEAFRNFLHHGQSVDVTLRVRTKQGTTFAVLETASAVADEDGAILACRVHWRAAESLARRAIASQRRTAHLESTDVAGGLKNGRRHG